MLLLTKSKDHQSNFPCKWIHRYLFQNLELNFRWPYKPFISRINKSDTKTTGQKEKLILPCNLELNNFLLVYVIGLHTNQYWHYWLSVQYGNKIDFSSLLYKKFVTRDKDSKKLSSSPNPTTNSTFCFTIYFYQLLVFFVYWTVF